MRKFRFELLYPNGYACRFARNSPSVAYGASFPSGDAFSARIRFVRLTVTVKATIVSVLLVFVDKGTRNKPSPLWEDICKQIRPQRRDISRNIREMIDAVAVDEVHHADAPSSKRTFSCNITQIHSTKKEVK